MTAWPVPPKPGAGEADEQPQQREAPRGARWGGGGGDYSCSLEASDDESDPAGEGERSGVHGLSLAIPTSATGPKAPQKKRCHPQR